MQADCSCLPCLGSLPRSLTGHIHRAGATERQQILASHFSPFQIIHRCTQASEYTSFSLGFPGQVCLMNIKSKPEAKSPFDL